MWPNKYKDLEWYYQKGTAAQLESGSEYIFTSVISRRLYITKIYLIHCSNLHYVKSDNWCLFFEGLKIAAITTVY